MIKRNHYLSPECELDGAIFIELICTSPTEGGLEDIGYEDWIE